MTSEVVATGRLRQVARRVPGLPRVYRALRRLYKNLRRLDAERVFTEIYATNAWKGKESVSGPGSSLDRTETIRRELEALLAELKTKTILDLACGDFNWMRKVVTPGQNYVGVDIVGELVERNERKYGSANVSFRRLDLLTDSLPRADLVIARDCFVHLTSRHVFSALRNICQSGSEYLLTTTFAGRKSNPGIALGEWRPLSLEAAPFHLPPPAKTINENLMEDGGLYSDKSLGLWRIEEIRKSLKGR